MAVDWNGVRAFGPAPESVQAVLRPSAYCLIADDRGLMAVVRTSLGLYLPGGGMETGESAAQTVVREAQEECGLDSSVGEWTACAIEVVYSPSDRCYYEKRSTFVDARCSDVRGQGIEPDHALEWATPEDAVRDLTDASHRWAVAEWISAVRPRRAEM